MELMHKESSYTGNIGVRNIARWSLESKPAKFLIMITTAHSIKILREVKKTLCISIYPLSNVSKHPLFSCRWREVDIKWIAQLALVSVSRYPP